jgi:hypothetical protein
LTLQKALRQIGQEQHQGHRLEYIDLLKTDYPTDFFFDAIAIIQFFHSGPYNLLEDLPDFFALTAPLNVPTTAPSGPLS